MRVERRPKKKVVCVLDEKRNKIGSEKGEMEKWCDCGRRKKNEPCYEIEDEE